MAGDWIKMRTDLHTDPAVIGIACAVGINEDEVVGKLHRIWSWADIHTVDGNAPSVSVSWIDRYLDVSGFAKAMCDVEWLSCQCDDGRSGVRFPNFDRHNGKTAKTRALTAKRVSKHKEKSNGESVSKVTATPLPREEKRREEKNKENKANAIALPVELDRPGMPEAWAEWCKHRKEIKKPITPTTAKRQFAFLLSQPADQRVTIIETAIRNSWQGLFEVSKQNATPKRDEPEYKRFEFDANGECTNFEQPKLRRKPE